MEFSLFFDIIKDKGKSKMKKKSKKIKAILFGGASLLIVSLSMLPLVSCSNGSTVHTQTSQPPSSSPQEKDYYSQTATAGNGFGSSSTNTLSYEGQQIWYQNGLEVLNAGQTYTFEDLMTILGTWSNLINPTFINTILLNSKFANSSFFKETGTTTYPSLYKYMETSLLMLSSNLSTALIGGMESSNVWGNPNNIYWSLALSNSGNNNIFTASITSFNAYTQNGINIWVNNQIIAMYYALTYIFNDVIANGYNYLNNPNGITVTIPEVNNGFNMNSMYNYIDNIYTTVPLNYLFNSQSSSTEGTTYYTPEVGSSSNKYGVISIQTLLKWFAPWIKNTINNDMATYKKDGLLYFNTQNIYVDVPNIAGQPNFTYSIFNLNNLSGYNPYGLIDYGGNYDYIFSPYLSSSMSMTPNTSGYVYGNQSYNWIQTPVTGNPGYDETYIFGTYNNRLIVPEVANGSLLFVYPQVFQFYMSQWEEQNAINSPTISNGYSIFNWTITNSSNYWRSNPTFNNLLRNSDTFFGNFSFGTYNSNFDNLLLNYSDYLSHPKNNNFGYFGFNLYSSFNSIPYNTTLSSVFNEDNAFSELSQIFSLFPSTGLSNISFFANNTYNSSASIKFGSLFDTNSSNANIFSTFNNYPTTTITSYFQYLAQLQAQFYGEVVMPTSWTNTTYGNIEAGLSSNSNTLISAYTQPLNINTYQNIANQTNYPTINYENLANSGQQTITLAQSLQNSLAQLYNNSNNPNHTLAVCRILGTNNTTLQELYAPYNSNIHLDTLADSANSYLPVYLTIHKETLPLFNGLQGDALPQNVSLSDNLSPYLLSALYPDGNWQSITKNTKSVRMILTAQQAYDFYKQNNGTFYYITFGTTPSGSWNTNWTPQSLYVSNSNFSGSRAYTSSSSTNITTHINNSNPKEQEYVSKQISLWQNLYSSNIISQKIIQPLISKEIVL